MSKVRLVCGCAVVFLLSKDNPARANAKIIDQVRQMCNAEELSDSNAWDMAMFEVWFQRDILPVLDARPRVEHSRRATVQR